MNFGTWIGLVVFFISLYILWQIKQLLLLLFTGIVLATSLNILVKKLPEEGNEAYLRRSVISIIIDRSCNLLRLDCSSPFIDQFQDLGRLVPIGIERLDIWIGFLSERLDPRIINFLPDTEELNKQFQPLIQQFWAEV